MTNGPMTAGAGRRARADLAVAGLLAAATVFILPESHAQEPAGTITLSRDIPARDAFRAGPPGPAYRVATAREDVVIANARALESSVANMPGLAQGDPASGPAALASHVPAAIGAAVLDANLARLPSATGGGAMPGSAIASSMGSLAGTLNTMMRGR